MIQRRPDRRGTVAVLLAFVFAIVFLTMPGRYYVGDPHYWQEEAIRLLTKGQLWLEPRLIEGKAEGQYAVLNPKDGLYHSKFGVMNAILTLPPLAAEYVFTGELPVKRPPIRVLFLNLYNLLLSVLIAAVLFRITSRYSENVGLRIGYVVACLFATFLWNYLRAQSGEIYQVLLFALLFDRLLHWRDVIEEAGGALNRSVVRAGAIPWVLVATLCLSRLSYVMLTPIVVGAAVLAMAFARRRAGLTGLMPCLVLILPALVVGGIIGGVNDWKFGSPFMTGYEEWRPEIHHWNGHITDGVLGFLIDPQRSVFICFPPMIAALPGFRRFAREHLFDAAVIAVTFVVFLFALGMLPSWRGEWSYGPRYFAFLLPIASLPCLSFFDGLRTWSTAWARSFVTGVAVLVVTASVFLQVEVNRLWFFSYYVMRERPLMHVEGAPRTFILRAPFGWINYDLTRVDGDFEQLSYVKQMRQMGLNEELTEYEGRLADMAFHSNYYWSFMVPGAMPPSQR